MKDIVIIGSGPAGLSAALYAHRAGLDTVIIEKEYGGAGQITESNMVDNYLGIPGIDGYELGERFREHVLNNGIEIINAEVSDISEIEPTDTANKGWQITKSDGDILCSRTVIYATGASHRMLGCAGEEELLGCGVSYCAICDGAFHKGKEVAIVGGGDTALDDALYLSRLCKKVHLIHRRDSFRASKKTVDAVKNTENISLELNTNVESINGEDLVESVTLKNGKTLKVSGVFIAVGQAPQTKLLEGKIELSENGYVVSDETGKTNRPGFYVAGDVRTKRLRQVVTAVSDGANAVTNIEDYLK